jgi:hypothetical protein
MTHACDFVRNQITEFLLVSPLLSQAHAAAVPDGDSLRSRRRAVQHLRVLLLPAPAARCRRLLLHTHHALSALL